MPKQILIQKKWLRCSMIIGFTAAMFGCFTETDVPFEVPSLVLFSGVYENTSKQDTLTFDKGLVVYKTLEDSVTRSYRVEDDLIHIEMAASSKEKRADLVMRIQEDGQFLTCNTCAVYLMSNFWERLPSQ